MFRLTNASLQPEDLPKLIEALHHTECAVLELDLSFNRLGDAGLTFLCETLCREKMCAFELTKLCIGGNTTSLQAEASARKLLAVERPDILLDCTPILRY